MVHTEGGGDLEVKGLYFGDDPTVIIYYDESDTSVQSRCNQTKPMVTTKNGKNGAAKYWDVDYSTITCKMPEGQGSSFSPYAVKFVVKHSTGTESASKPLYYHAPLRHA